MTPPRQVGPTAAQLLATARAVLDRPGGPWGAQRTRAAALFARQALEDAVTSYWSGPTAGLAHARFTTQLLCLPYYLDDSHLARQTHHTWCALSSACHAHPYQLAPNADEISGWLDVIDEILLANERALGPAGPAGPASRPLRAVQA